jgi:hypothetical protein
MEPAWQDTVGVRGLVDLGATRRQIPARVRELASDRRVRQAAAATVESGRRVWEQASGSKRKDLAGRLARDRRMQEEALSLVRSATKTVDEGRAHRLRRRRRPVWMFAGGVIGALWILGAAARRGRPFASDPGSTHRNDAQPAQSSADV